MDVINPFLVWVDGLCYRFYESNIWSPKDHISLHISENPEYDDVIDDSDDQQFVDAIDVFDDQEFTDNDKDFRNQKSMDDDEKLIDNNKDFENKKFLDDDNDFDNQRSTDDDKEHQGSIDNCKDSENQRSIDNCKEIENQEFIDNDKDFEDEELVDKSEYIEYQDSIDTAKHSENPEFFDNSQDSEFQNFYDNGEEVKNEEYIDAGDNFADLNSFENLEFIGKDLEKKNVDYFEKYVDDLESIVSDKDFENQEFIDTVKDFENQGSIDFENQEIVDDGKDFHCQEYLDNYEDLKTLKSSDLECIGAGEYLEGTEADDTCRHDYDSQTIDYSNHQESIDAGGDSDRQESIDAGNHFDRQEIIDAGNHFDHRESIDAAKNFNHQESIDAGTNFDHQESIDTGNHFDCQESIDAENFKRQKIFETDKDLIREDHVDFDKNFVHQESNGAGENFVHQESVNAGEDFEKKEPIDSGESITESNDPTRNNDKNNIVYTGKKLDNQGTMKVPSDIRIVPMPKNGFKHAFTVPGQHISALIGRKGKTQAQLEFETETRLTIPRIREGNEIVIMGLTRESILEARRRIDSIIESNKQMQVKNEMPLFRSNGTFTHFISIPMLNKIVIGNYARFRKLLLDERPDIRKKYGEKIFVKPEKLHVTLCMLSLPTGRHVKMAIKALEEFGKNILRPFIAKMGPIKLRLQGVRGAREGTNYARYLFSNVFSENNLLRILEEEMKRYLSQKGILAYMDRPSDLLIKLMDVELTELPTTRFYARCIVSEYDNYYFGDIEPKSIHLSERGQYTKYGYYSAAAKIFTM